MSTTTPVSSRTRVNRPPDNDTTPGEVADSTIEAWTGIFQMLGDKSRLKILLTLARDGEMHVSALCQMLRQSQPAVSHHLTLLRMNKLVHFRRDGKHNYYCIETGSVRDLLEQIFSDSANGHPQPELDGFPLVYKSR